MISTVEQARQIFEELSSLKSSTDPPPCQAFSDYCRGVLAGVERLHFDFKEKRDRRLPRLEDDDKGNLAKAISGFANSSGGVLIWGMEDRSLAPKPITQVDSFLSNLLQLSAACIDPAVAGIDGDFILVDGEGDRPGFAFILIPESQLPPHRVSIALKDIRNQYYYRTADSFQVATHTMLEDMFGRRPKPKLSFYARMLPGSAVGNKRSLKVILGIRNDGRGLAKYPFLSVRVHPPYQVSSSGIDGNQGVGLPVVLSRGAEKENRYGAVEGFVIHSGVDHDVTAVKVEVDVGDVQATLQVIPDVRDLVIDYRIAAEGMQIIEDRHIISGDELIDHATGRR